MKDTQIRALKAENGKTKRRAISNGLFIEASTIALEYQNLIQNDIEFELRAGNIQKPIQSIE